MSLLRTTTCILLAAGLVLLGPAALATNDPGLPDQWGLAKVGAPDAWNISKGAGITVAVVDSGVDLGHEDLKGRLVGGHNFVEDGQPPQDDNGHGTHVAGIVGAATGNGIGVASMAPDVKVMPLRALRDDGNGQATGSSSDVEAAIRWAADHGAHVINLSLGENVVIRSVLGSSIGDAIEYAWGKGVVSVVAAGNDFLFPSGYGNTNAIVVAATGKNDQKPSYSNGVGSAKWGMAAPGGEGGTNGILSTYWESGKSNTYAYASGTSMAAPHVSGAAAQLRALGKSPPETIDILLKTADDVGASGRDSTFGSGRLNALSAVRVATGQPAPQPQPEPESGGGGSGGSAGSGGGSSPGSTPAKRTSRPASTTPTPASGASEASAALDATTAPSADAQATPTPRGVTAAGESRDLDGGMSWRGWAAAAIGGVVVAGAGGLLFVRLRGWL